MTHPQQLLAALRATATNGRCDLTNTELHAAMGREPITRKPDEVSRSLANLEAQGLVRREYTPGSRKRVVVLL